MGNWLQHLYLFFFLVFGLLISNVMPTELMQSQAKLVVGILFVLAALKLGVSDLDQYLPWQKTIFFMSISSIIVILLFRLLEVMA